MTLGQFSARRVCVSASILLAFPRIPQKNVRTSLNTAIILSSFSEIVTFPFGYRHNPLRGAFSLLFLTILSWGMLLARSSLACSPIPGARPASLEARVEDAPYVLEATVENANEDILTLNVLRYFKGHGPTQIQIRGFNQTSCDDFIQASGDRYIFFGTGDIDGILSAVYDGAFGSTRAASEETLARLTELTADRKADRTSQGLEILDFSQFLAELERWLDRPVAVSGQLEIESKLCTRMACQFPPDAQAGDRITCNSCMGTPRLTQSSDRISLVGMGCSGVEILTYLGNDRFDTTIEWQSCQLDNGGPLSGLNFSGEHYAVTGTLTPKDDEACVLNSTPEYDFKVLSLELIKSNPVESP